MPAPISASELPGDEVASRFEGADHGAAVSFFLTRFPPGGGPRPHRHPYEETFIVEAGTASFTVDGETVDVGADQIVVVPAGAVHGFVNSGADTLRLISIQPAARMVVEWVDA
jgi:quercetin dioxygenase-like cupin family protein